MEPTTNDDTSALSIAALASALLLVVLCLATLVSGVSQQWFESASPPAIYAAELVRGATALRVIIGVDDLFIAAYTTAVILFATHMYRMERSPVSVLIGVGSVAAGLLDLHENHHILNMLALAEADIPPSLAEILQRSTLSQLKWMTAHLSFVLLAAIWPGRDLVSRAVRWSLVMWQLPVGIMVWVITSPFWHQALLWTRYLSLFFGFLLMLWLVRRAPPARRHAALVGSPSSAGS
ncbi:MAG: hypothetical protein JWN48_356 [Myxococcaceae bacterium]|nr:hypothetical protein [Myxococcaceae bacterium]